MTKISLLLLSSTFVLSACAQAPYSQEKMDVAQNWTQIESINKPDILTGQSAQYQTVQIPQNLKNWWQDFNDPVLNKFVETALANSPDRTIAESKILEARGQYRSAKSSLLPQIGASANAGRQDTGSTLGGNPFNSYDAAFDASYEIDLFGQNRNNTTAAQANTTAQENSYDNVSLTLVAEVGRAYVEYRGFEDQLAIAQNNLDTQTETLKLVKLLTEVGENPQLDVERASALVNNTRASIPEFERLANNTSLRLVTLTGMLPAEIMTTLDSNTGIPGTDITPVLLAPAVIIQNRPDIKAAEANLIASTALRKAAIADLYPSFTISGLFGITDNNFASNANIWSIALGGAVKLLDFGRIEGQIDVAKAVEKGAFEQYRKAVLNSVAEVETALNDFTQINRQRTTLQQSFDNANEALKLSQLLFNEGEIAFLDVLDAQRSANSAESALSTATTNQVTALIRVYKSLGIY